MRHCFSQNTHTVLFLKCGTVLAKHAHGAVLKCGTVLAKHAHVAVLKCAIVLANTHTVLS